MYIYARYLFYMQLIGEISSAKSYVFPCYITLPRVVISEYTLTIRTEWVYKREKNSARMCVYVFYSFFYLLTTII